MRFQESWKTKRRRRACSGAGGAVRRWLLESRGQDLIEYALLSATIGFAGYVALNVLTGAMNTTYTSWDEAVQECVVVEVQCPAGDPNCVSTCAGFGSGALSPP
jgi:hypothetical protein